MSKSNMGMLGTVFLLVLVGCGGNGTGSNPDATEVDTIFSADSEGDSPNILDAEALGASIDRLFGDEDTESLDLTPTDTTADVFSRVKNG